MINVINGGYVRAVVRVQQVVQDDGDGAVAQ